MKLCSPHMNPIIFCWDIPWATEGARRPCPIGVWEARVAVGEFVQKAS